MVVRQVVYVSSGSREFEHEALRGLLEDARAHIVQADITGVLFYLNGNFIQLLEGEDPGLKVAMARNRQDSSHRNLVQLSDLDIAERAFSDFGTAFETGTERNLSADANYMALTMGKMPNGENQCLGVTFFNLPERQWRPRFLVLRQGEMARQ